MKNVVVAIADAKLYKSVTKILNLSGKERRFIYLITQSIL